MGLQETASGGTRSICDGSHRPTILEVEPINTEGAHTIGLKDVFHGILQWLKSTW